MTPKIKSIFFVLSVLFFAFNTSFQPKETAFLELQNGSRISMIGGNLGSRMMNYGYFEIEMYVRNPDKSLIFRNMCDGGDTPGFRPHSSRNLPWAFAGAEKFQTEFAKKSDSEGFFETPDEWLTRLKTDIIIAFFGFSESFEGKKGIEMYRKEVDAFLKHTRQKSYNGVSSPQLVLVSPIAFEDLSSVYDLPNGRVENENLWLYTQTLRAVCEENNVLFVDAFSTSKKWYEETAEPLTIDGSQMNDLGYQKLAKLLANEVFGKQAPVAEANREVIQWAVSEKNWMWHNDYKIPNGVHVYGRRYNPFGPDNYPAEIEKIRQLTEIRDRAIWLAATEGKKMDLALADKATRPLPDVKTNFTPEKNEQLRYLYGEEAVASLTVPTGYKVELFASEKEFPDLANPVQLSFDNKGRLWVATMPSYPHYKPGDAKPNDKLLILEDTNNDGKADKQTVFAEGLHLPLGFEFAPEGVFVSQGTNLKLYTDTNNDDKADKVEIVLSGFDDHDTHHNSSAFCADPSGAIYSGEGVFLHTNVETSYGTVRATNGGFYRYSPQLRKLERVAQLAIPNPWGIAFDAWGQPFFAETSGPDVYWMTPGSILPRYGEVAQKGVQLIEKDHLVRPTSGMEFISSRHFPENVQGDMLMNNTIGFLGMKQHQMINNGSGYTTKHRQDLLVGKDPNFRPVDMEFAPDGSLYVVDWHNILIGHMQHNARDPLRDHVHGRIYRITYPSRPLVSPAKIDGASIEMLLENLKLPEYRTKYRTRRELRSRNAVEVQQKLKIWLEKLPKNDPNYEKYQLEALWVSWGINKVDAVLLNKLLQANDFRVRAAAVEVVRFTGHQLGNQAELLMQAAADEHSRVRLGAMVAVSWIGKEKGLPILEKAKQKPFDVTMQNVYETAKAHLNGRAVEKSKQQETNSKLTEKDAELFKKGQAIYAKEGYCSTCHQADGKGLPSSGFPSLSGTQWVTGNEERLVKILLKGMMGAIEVNGKNFKGQVPMTPFEGLLNDEEIASVATFIRNSFGNEAAAVSPEKVKQVRAAIKNKKDFYQSAKLLKEHPME